MARRAKYLQPETRFYFSGNGRWKPAYGKIIQIRTYTGREIRYLVQYETPRYPNDPMIGEVHPLAFEPHATQCFKTLDQLEYEATYEERISTSASHP